jgi:hypothetical protein
MHTVFRWISLNTWRGFEPYLPLPCQISPEYQDILDEEISQVEVEDAIN